MVSWRASWFGVAAMPSTSRRYWPCPAKYGANSACSGEVRARGKSADANSAAMSSRRADRGRASSAGVSSRKPKGRLDPARRSFSGVVSEPLCDASVQAEAGEGREESEESRGVRSERRGRRSSGRRRGREWTAVELTLASSGKGDAPSEADICAKKREVRARVRSEWSWARGEPRRRRISKHESYDMEWHRIQLHRDPTLSAQAQSESYGCRTHVHSAEYGLARGDRATERRLRRTRVRRKRGSQT